MITTTVYQCEICGKTFDNEYDCRVCELAHSFSEFGPAIHLYDKHRKPVSPAEGSPDDIYFAHCNNKDAAKAIYDWCNEQGLCSPYDMVFEEGKEFNTGLYFFDDEERFGPANWVSLSDLKDELEELANHFQQ